MDEDAPKPLSPKLLEPILSQQPISEYIEAFSWVTRNLLYVDESGVTIEKAEIQDFSRMTKLPTGVFGVVPSLMNATHDEVFEVYYQDPSTTLSIYEQLFTARGS